MNKKVIAIFLVVLFTIITLYPNTLAEDEYKRTGVFTDLSSYLIVNWNQTEMSEPIVPRGEKKSVNLSITYGVALGGLFKLLTQLKFALQKGKQANINLNIIDRSDGCNAILAQNQILATVSDEEQVYQTKLQIQLDENAPAYKIGFVKINVSVDAIKGILGLTKINGYQDQCTVEFIPAYLPLIKPEIPRGRRIEITPYNRTSIPIIIKNLGNARTSVYAEIVNVSEKWNVTITDQIVLDIGDENKVYLTVTTDHKFNAEAIRIKLTPARTENRSDIGNSHYISILFENDRSFKEEQAFKMDTTFLFIIVIIIIIFIIISILRNKRK